MVLYFTKENTNNSVDYKFSINIPEMRNDTFLVLQLDFDLKETKGGREEIVLQEPIGVNNQPKSKSELLVNTGQKQIRRRYNLSNQKRSAVAIDPRASAASCLT